MSDHKQGREAALAIVYISSTGNDENDGLGPTTPVKTMTRAQQILDALPKNWVKMVKSA